MKQSDIEVGGVYRGANGATRTVLDIYYSGPYKNSFRRVKYNTGRFDHNPSTIFLVNFARWAKERVR